MATFRVDTSSRAGTYVVSLSGDLDLAATTVLEGWASQLNGEKEVLVDLSDVPFMDSSGLGRLIQLQADVERRGLPLRLRGVGPNVARVFDLTGLRTRFTFVGE